MKVLVTTKTRLYRKCTRFFCQETWNYQIIKISIYAPHIPFTLRQAQYHKAQKYNLAETLMSVLTEDIQFLKSPA